MIKVELKVDKGIVKDAIISGDFFAYPSEMIEEIETKILGHKIDEILEIVERYRNRVKLVGVKFDDLKELLELLIRKSREERGK